MATFKKIDDAPEGLITICTPAGDVEVDAKPVKIDNDALSSEVRITPFVVETDDTTPAPKAKEEK
jgi:hypothetical protein